MKGFIFAPFLVLLALVSATCATYVVVGNRTLPNGVVEYDLVLQGGTGGPYGADSQHLTMEVSTFTKDMIRVRIIDSNETRWQVPNILRKSPQRIANPTLSVSVSSRGTPFGFRVHRAGAHADVIFDTISTALSNPMIFEDQYLTINTKVGTAPNIYGLGERASRLNLPYYTPFTIFARDVATPMYENMYGSHPFYLELRKGIAHGVFLLNSNAMDILVTENTVEYKVIGGVLDYFFFSGPTPRDVVRQYLSLIGVAEMPAYWTLGWHQCKWGYKTLAESQEVVKQYAQHNIPLETMWNDIDYMNGYRDFTTDPINYPLPEYKKWVDELHANGQHYMVIVDPGIKYEPGNPTFDSGLKADLYIKNKDGNNLLGKVWPGLVYFPDYTHPNTPQWWHNEIVKFKEMISFDGLWIDMNEVANFCEGECPPEPGTVAFTAMKALMSKNLTASQRGNDFKSSRFDADNPPFKPNNGGAPLYSHTISLTAKQHVGSVYNAHSLYGHDEAVVTRAALDKIFGKRSLLLTRSTFAGTGRHASHWLGDNHSSWNDLWVSIPGVISMGLFGIPHVGADICGFVGATTKELCTRWTQLGVFYPFSRNHNAVNEPSQEPYVFGPEVAKIAADHILLKYSILPYYYTLHYHAATVGDPVIRGLFYEFPHDSMTPTIDTQMMVGPHLLITPVLADGARSAVGYFPAARWFDFYNGKELDSRDGLFLLLDAPIEKINVHVRGGGIIPRQKPEMTIAACRKNPLTVLIALDQNNTAAGDLYLDDGETLTSSPVHVFSRIQFVVQGNQLFITPIASSYLNIPPFDGFTLYGLTKTPSRVYNGDFQVPPTNVQWDSNFNVLTVVGLNNDLLERTTISWE